jgi:hypothetical protein
VAMLKREFNKIRLSPKQYLKANWRSPKLDDDDRRDITFLTNLNCQSLISAETEHTTSRNLVILCFLPLPYVLKMEGILARLLAGRGWTVNILTNVSMERMAKSYHQSTQGFSVLLIEDYLSFNNIKKINLKISKLFQIENVDIAIIKQLYWDGVPVGVHAMATYLSGEPEGRYDNSKTGRKRLKRILRRSMLYVEAANNFLLDAKPNLILGMEKGFVGTCEIFYTALQKKINYVQWVGCHEPNSIMFKKYKWESRRDHPFSIGEYDWAWIQKLPWSEIYRDKLMQEFNVGYMRGDWFKYKFLTEKQSFSESNDLKISLGLDVKKKTAIIYSHILSDANLFYGEDLFSNGYEEWLVETVRRASANDNVNWVLKLHPANRVRNLRMGYFGDYGELQALRNAFGEVPDFLNIVLPESTISPMSFFQITDYGITVRGTVGIELPCFGIPVLTAGTGRYSGKGFTNDASDIEHYLYMIENIHEIKPLSDTQVKLAIKYAYFVFRVRPAKYDEILMDTYEHDYKHPRYRDLKVRLPKLADINKNPQMQAILDFLEDQSCADFFSDMKAPISIQSNKI